MGARFSDDSELDYVYWDNFWLMYESDYYPTDWLPITVPEHVEADEDIVCVEGYFVSETRQCLRCPPGCIRCSEAKICLDCTHNFELVFGDQFSYCFPKCFEGQYRFTEYSSAQALMTQFDIEVTEPKYAIMPKEMMQTCLVCPEQCAECYASSEPAQAVCSKCAPDYEMTAPAGECIRRNSQHAIDFIVESHVVNRCDDIVM